MFQNAALCGNGLRGTELDKVREYIITSTWIKVQLSHLFHLLQGGDPHPGMDMLYEYHSNQSGDPDNVLMHALGHWRLTEGFHDVIFYPKIVVSVFCDILFCCLITFSNQINTPFLTLFAFAAIINYPFTRGQDELFPKQQILDSSKVKGLHKFKFVEKWQ